MMQYDLIRRVMAMLVREMEISYVNNEWYRDHKGVQEVEPLSEESPPISNHEEKELKEEYTENGYAQPVENYGHQC